MVTTEQAGQDGPRFSAKEVIMKTKDVKKEVTERPFSPLLSDASLPEEWVNEEQGQGEVSVGARLGLDIVHTR